jgi:hypothetical protein
MQLFMMLIAYACMGIVMASIVVVIVDRLHKAYRRYHLLLLSLIVMSLSGILDARIIIRNIEMKYIFASLYASFSFGFGLKMSQTKR